LPLEALLADFAPPPSKFIDVGGLHVHYRDEGAGPAVLLLHGAGASLHTWEEWAAALRPTHRVVRLDLPGFGLTGPFPDDEYHFKHVVAFLDQFVDAVGLHEFAVAGNSLGGELAWRYAVAHPARVTRLILVDAAGYPVFKRPLAYRLARTPLLSWLLMHMGSRALVERTVRDVYADPAKITPALVDRYYRLMLRAGNRRAFVARSRLPRGDQAGEIRLVRAPTLVMWGAEDRLFPVDNARRFAADISGARLLVYNGVGHVPMEEIGARSAADAQAFLDGN
jgi:pimeloyl-ACP methyl ester carboxylesterase